MDWNSKNFLIWSMKPVARSFSRGVEVRQSWASLAGMPDSPPADDGTLSAKLPMLAQAPLLLLLLEEEELDVKVAGCAKAANGRTAATPKTDDALICILRLSDEVRESVKEMGIYLDVLFPFPFFVQDININ